MKATSELLQYVCENARMCADITNQLTGIVMDPRLLDHLRMQKSEYEEVYNDACIKLHRLGYGKQVENPFVKQPTYLEIYPNNLTDRSTTSIAEIMIQSCTMGMVEITKRMHALLQADEHAQALARRLLRAEENNIEQLKMLL